MRERERDRETERKGDREKGLESDLYQQAKTAVRRKANK